MYKKARNKSFRAFFCMSTVTITDPDTGVKKTAREMNKTRQKNILDKMLEQGYIDEDTYQKAINEDLKFTDGSVSAQELVAADNADKSNGAATGINSYFVDQVILDVSNDLAKQLGISAKEARIKLYNGGYTIYSTEDPHIQEIAESIYEDRSNLDVTSSSGQHLQSGITIVDPSTGNVVAMEVSTRFYFRIEGSLTDAAMAFGQVEVLSEDGETGFLTDRITGREALEQSRGLNVLACLRVLG